jgi:hypothetical protein
MEQIRELVVFSVFIASSRHAIAAASGPHLRRLAPRSRSSRLRHWLDPEHAVSGGIAPALGIAVVGGRRAQTDGERRVVGSGSYCCGDTVCGNDHSLARGLSHDLLG